MNISDLSVTFTISNLEETRRFYERYFGAKASFDCGWYVILRLTGIKEGPEICFMEPRDGAQAFTGGATLNLRVTEVDAVHTQLTEKGLTPLIPLEDHPWGDRGFGILDPCGIVVYFYQDIEPSAQSNLISLN